MTKGRRWSFARGAGKRLLTLALAKLRLSPLMAMILCALCVVDAGAALFALGSIFAPLAAPPQLEPEWRLPGAASSAPRQGARTSAGEQTLARPIFSKSRRPFAAPPVETQSKIEEAPVAATGLSVTAIVKTGGVKRVLIVSSAEPEGKWALEGERLEGWTIAEVRDFDVTLRNGQNVVQLKLYSDHPPTQDAHAPAQRPEPE